MIKKEKEAQSAAMGAAEQLLPALSPAPEFSFWNQRVMNGLGADVVIADDIRICAIQNGVRVGIGGPLQESDILFYNQGFVSVAGIRQLLFKTAVAGADAFKSAVNSIGHNDERIFAVAP